MASIKFNNIQSMDLVLEEKEYPFVMQTELVTTSGGYKCIQINYTHLGSPTFTIKFDKCIYGTLTEDFNQEVVAVRLGLNKLKNLNEATVNLEDLDPAILVKVLNNKKVMAKIKKGDKYYEIDGITPFSKYEEPTTPSEAVAPTTFTLTDDEDPFND